MNFIDNIEELKNRLHEKLERFDFSVTSDDRVLLLQDDELRSFFWKQLDAYSGPWQPGFEEFVSNILGDSDFDAITPNIMYHYLITSIDDGEPCESLWGLSERSEDVKQYLLEKLKDPNYRLNTFEVETLPLLIQTKRYDLILSFSGMALGEISKEVLQDIVEQAPYSLRSFPTEILREIERDSDLIYYRENHPEHASIRELLDLYLVSPTPTLWNLLVEKSLHPTPYSYEGDTFPLEDFKVFYQQLDSSQQNQLLSVLIHHNQMILAVSLMSSEQIKNFMPEMITSMKDGNIHDLDGRTDFPNKYALLYDAEFVKSLIESGEIAFAMESPAFISYLPLMAVQIQNHNPHYEKYRKQGIKIHEIFFENEELIRALVANGFVKNYYPIKSNLSHVQKMIELSAEYNQPIAISPDKSSLEYLFEQALSSGNANYLLSMLDNVMVDFNHLQAMSEERCHQLVHILQGQISLQQKLLERSPNFVIKHPILMDGYLSLNEFSLSSLLNYIEHHEELHSLYTMDLYQKVKGYFATKYDIPIARLDQVAEYFGPEIIQYVGNHAIGQMCQLDEEQFQKVFALFPKTKFTMQDALATYDSLKQYEFGQTHPEVIEIFANIKHSITDNTGDYLQLLQEIYSVVNDKLFKKLEGYYENLKKNPNYEDFDHQYSSFANFPAQFRQAPKQFLLWLVTQMKSQDPIQQELSTDILHFLSNYYIAFKREEYRSNCNMLEELEFPYSFDEKDCESKTLRALLSQNRWIVDVASRRANPFQNLVVRKLQEQGFSDTMIQDLFSCYLKKGEPLQNNRQEVQKNIRFLVEAGKQCMKEYVSKRELEQISYELDDMGMLKRNYEMPAESSNIYPLLCNLRIDVLREHVLSPEHSEVYESLCQTMKKYKLHVLPDVLKSLLERKTIDISSDSVNIASFLSYYHQIYETERKKLLGDNQKGSVMISLTSALKQADALSSVSSVYSQILTPENMKLIKYNPNPNAARSKIANNERLNEAIQDTIKLYQRQEVTIPTFTTTVTTASNKELYVSVGNFTNPTNLTHGERTGACMRIGGVGESLYQFCIEDKNGFHIRFESPSGKYVSRVSGFRNGNTVFLNELRNSCEPEEYQDEDIVDACTQIANTLIEISKDSPCPIENVVVASAYATEKMSPKPLSIDNPTVGLRHFYTDITSSAVVLATTAKEGDFTPIDFHNENVPTYRPVREKAKQGNQEELKEMINRVHSVQQLLQGKDYRYLEPVVFEDGMQYGIVSQDWYVYVDDHYQIHEEYISIDERALEELKTARKLIEEKISTIQETTSYHK